MRGTVARFHARELPSISCHAAVQGGLSADGSIQESLVEGDILISWGGSTEERRVFAETQGGEAHAGLVLRRPTGRTLFTLGVDWFLASLAEAEGGEAVTVVVGGLVEGVAWPAGTGGALALGVVATRAKLLATRGLWEFRWGLTETNRGKAHTGLVLSGPARRALLARGVDGLFSAFAEGELSKAVARLIWGRIERTAWPTRVGTLASWVFAFGTEFLAA